MTDQQKFKTYCSWIAIDIAKDFNVVMLETADGQTRRFKMANSGKDHDRLIEVLRGLPQPCHVGFENTQWSDQYPQIGKSWTSNWVNLRTIFDYPPEIRRAIYTTNAIESLNSVIRSATKRRKLFPNETSAMKAVYLAIMQVSKKWTMPIQNWRAAMNRFEIEPAFSIRNF